MKKESTYKDVEREFNRKSRKRRDINGEEIHCTECVGYCKYCEHKGFLNEALRKEHNCLGNNCHYYLEKKKEEILKNEAFNPELEKFNKKKTLIDNLIESFKKENIAIYIKPVKLDNLNECRIEYYPFTNSFNFDNLIKQIEVEASCTAALVKLKYDLDNAYEIFYNSLIA